MFSRIHSHLSRCFVACSCTTNRFRRDFLAAYISASSDPDTYGKITVLTIPGQVNGPKLAFNAISTDTAVSQGLALQRNHHLVGGGQPVEGEHTE